MEGLTKGVAPDQRWARRANALPPYPTLPPPGHRLTTSLSRERVWETVADGRGEYRAGPSRLLCETRPQRLPFDGSAAHKQRTRGVRISSLLHPGASAILRKPATRHRSSHGTRSASRVAC